MKKDYEKLQKECLEEVKAANIKPAKDITWKINYRAKRRWGMCTIKPFSKCIIEISSRLLEDDRITVKACKETIIHEILHSCRGCSKHTGKWLEYARRMNDLYGYDIKRVTTGEEKGVENYVPKEEPVKFRYVCKTCGQIIEKKRVCKFTKRYKSYICGICGTYGAFERVDVDNSQK